MKINVTENKVSIKEEQILNENEYNIHKIQFDFSSEYTDDLVKVALFSIDNHTYKKIISNNECDIPPEVLTQRGYSILGVYAYKTEQDTLVLRYSPSPTRISVYDGSYKAEAENSEPITPSEIEQYQQILQNSLQNFQNEFNTLAQNTETSITEIEEELQRKVDEGYFDGKDGYTPQKGVDYFTQEDIEEIEGDILNEVYTKSETDTLLEGKADTTDIPDVSSFITKDVNNLTNYTLKTNTGSLIDLEINDTTYVVTLKLKNQDGTVISTDTIDLPLESVVVSGRYDNTTKKVILTLENGSEVDFSVADLVAGLQTEITSQNKLASDLIDDTNNGNKFVTTSEKQTWNNKYDKPNNGIPKTDLASDVQTSLGKADTAIQSHQDISGKEDETNKVTSIDNTSTDTQYPSAKCVYDSQEEQNTEIGNLQAENERLRNTIPTTTGTGQAITLNKTAELEFKKPPLPMGNSEQDGTPSLDNEAPITNVTGDVEVKVQNKNWFTSELENGWIDTNGKNSTLTGVNSWRSKNYIKIKENTTYILSRGITGKTINYIYFYDENYNYISRVTTNTFTTPPLAMYMRWRLDDSDTIKPNFIQLEQGSTATTCTPHKDQTFTFPLDNEKLMLGDYLADDGIHHVRGQVTESGTIVTLNDAKSGGAYLCSKKTSGNLVEKTLTFDEAITDALIEYELEEEVIVPYTSAQQTAYNQIKQALSYEEQTNISSNQNAIFNVEAYQDSKVILSEKVDKIEGKGLSTNDFTNTYKNSVDSNTSARHTHTNKTVLDGIASSDITNWNGKQNETDNSLNTTNKTITGAINEVYSIARGANQAVSYSNYQAMITAFNSLANDVYNVGQNVMIVTLQVPDLWISGIESSSSSYTYTTDEAITTALSTNGYIQVGYYKLSALETQKVDLTEYEQNTNKTTTISSSSTNAQYPSAKAVYDYIQSLDGDEVSY